MTLLGIQIYFCGKDTQFHAQLLTILEGIPEVYAGGIDSLNVERHAQSNDKIHVLILDADLMTRKDFEGILALKAAKKFDHSFVFASKVTQELVDVISGFSPLGLLNKPVTELELRAQMDFSVLPSLARVSEVSSLGKKALMADMQINDLMETQQHLVKATWRERELKQELKENKDIIEAQNKKIMDSINYARRIQKTILPESAQIEENLGEHFILYQSKDVVSGDFPWFYVREEYCYIAAVDCTGHGVPGAMMSLIAFLLLNDIVNNGEKPKTPAEVLNQLHDSLVSTLKQNIPGNKAADGLDIALCRIKKDKSEVLFSGAHRPLYLLTNQDVVPYKGCKFPIGGMQYSSGENRFEDSKVEVKKGDSIYIFSDGYPDQFGGEAGDKIGPKRIRDLIYENKGKNMTDMHLVFSEFFNNWKANDKQIDDVLMIGLQF